MAFEIDFNVSSADQKVDSLTTRLEKMSNAATKASASLIPSQKAIKAIKEVADAHTEISKSLDKVVKVSEDASKKMEKDMKDNETSVQKFFKQLDNSLTNNSHKVNAWRGNYGQATQDMMKANQQLKKESSELSKAQELTNAAKLAQAKQTNAQIVQEERGSLDKRSRDWTEYYKKQEAQVAKYTKFLKDSQTVWTNSAALNRQKLAQKMAKIAQQETKFELEAAKKRTAAWTDYYKNQNAQIDRYNSALTKSRAIVEKSRIAQEKHAKSMTMATGAQAKHTSSMIQSNQVTASFRSGMSALGMGIGIYTSSTIAAAAATYALVAAMKTTLTTGAEFEKNMYRVYAVTGQMGETFEEAGNLYVKSSQQIQKSQDELASAALESSKVTIFTAVQAAEGLVALGMAGLNAEQAIGALTPSLQLAQIGMIDVYESADIMTNVMLGFGMSIEGSVKSLENATLVTDVLASAVTNSNSTVKELARSLSYVAPIAHAAGGSIQETVAALETFHNVGIKGQRAGTSLRRAYVNLLEPTDKVASKLRDMSVSVRDSEGSMRTLTDIMLDLQKAGATTADLVTVFGVRAAPAMVAFMANLQEIVKETQRLTGSVDGAGKAMADFMATSTSGQWQIINSKIQEKFIKAFEDAKEDVKGLNYELMKFIDEGYLDGFFNTISNGISMLSMGASEALKIIKQVKEALPGGINGISPLDPLTNFVNVGTNFMKPDQGALPGVTTAQLPSVGDIAGRAGNSGPFAMWGEQGELVDQTFSRVKETVKEINKGLDTGVLKTTEQLEEQVRREESSKRLVKFAQMEANLLEDNTMRAKSSEARRDLSLQNEVVKYSEKLGLISQEKALQEQLANIDETRVKINNKYFTETQKLQTQLVKIREEVNTGSAADEAKYAELLREQAKLNEQIISQAQQLNVEASKLTLQLQESAMVEKGFGKLTEDTKSFANELKVANEKLGGNKQASEENTLAQLKNAVARREVWQATSEFNILSDIQKAAFEKETQAIKDQIPELAELIQANKDLTAAKAADKAAEKKQKSVLKDFSKGDGLSDAAKGRIDYESDLDRLRDYEDSKLELIKEYGLTDLEFQNMMVDSKLEIEQRYWDSQHENLAAWRDEWSQAIADNVEQALFMEQSWSEAAQNIARTMLGTVVNSMIQIGAEMAANYLMKQMFTTGEMAMDTAVAANKVASETTKQAANTTTAATEAAASASSLAYFAQMLGIGPALAAAWAPAAMYINIASFGAAGLAASATMALNGVVAAGAGLLAGAGAGAGQAISGSRQFGGPVTEGNSYLVGETGREVFTPETSGYITSNQDMQNSVQTGGNNYITYENKYYIDATGNEDMEERLAGAMEDAAEMSKRKVLEDMVNNGDIAKATKQIARS